MNQNRWTCLTTLVLTTVIAPLATVHAKTLPVPTVRSGDSYSPVSPQSLPTITPLTVTELETEAAIPVVSQSVPQVSKLPTVVPLYGRTKTQNFNRQQKIARVDSLPSKNLHSRSFVRQHQSIAPIFNPNSQVTTPILSIANPSERSISPVNAVVPLPQAIDRLPSKPKALTSFVSQTASAPILVVRSDKSQPVKGKAQPTTIITNSTTVQAEVAPIQPVPDSQFGKTETTQTATAITSDRPKTIPVPEVAPIVSQTNAPHAEGLRQRADTPSFEAGLPVFIFDNERPQQIVATAIAQVGDTIVAPEPSIAIPVERPKQSIIPTQLPATAPSSNQPGIEMVKIDQPAATVRPALDKIVATQTGKASWYGSEGGSQTANGERYNPNGLTAAHRTLPFGTKVRVTSLKTGKSAIVRINDRGPFRGNRIIDVSAGAAELIGIKNDGVGEVRVEILGSQG